MVRISPSTDRGLQLFSRKVPHPDQFLNLLFWVIAFIGCVPHRDENENICFGPSSTYHFKVAVGERGGGLYSIQCFVPEKTFFLMLCSTVNNVKQENLCE